MLTRLALLGSILCCAALLSGCIAVQPRPDGTFSVSFLPPSSNEVTGSSGPSSVVATHPPATRAPSGSGPVMPGTARTSGPWKVVVESTSAPRSLPDGATPHSRKHFLVVNVSIMNVGSSAALIVRAEQFRLIDTHGVTTKPYPTHLSAFNAQEVKLIDVGMGGFTQFVYEVPADAQEYGFVVTPKQGASGSMSWIVP